MTSCKARVGISDDTTLDTTVETTIIKVSDLRIDEIQHFLIELN